MLYIDHPECLFPIFLLSLFQTETPFLYLLSSTSPTAGLHPNDTGLAADAHVDRDPEKPESFWLTPRGNVTYSVTKSMHYIDQPESLFPIFLLPPFSVAERSLRVRLAARILSNVPFPTRLQVLHPQLAASRMT